MCNASTETVKYDKNSHLAQVTYREDVAEEGRENEKSSKVSSNCHLDHFSQ